MKHRIITATLFLLSFIALASNSAQAQYRELGWNASVADAIELPDGSIIIAAVFDFPSEYDGVPKTLRHSLLCRVRWFNQVDTIEAWGDDSYMPTGNNSYDSGPIVFIEPDTIAHINRYGYDGMRGRHFHLFQASTLSKISFEEAFTHYDLEAVCSGDSLLTFVEGANGFYTFKDERLGAILTSNDSTLAELTCGGWIDTIPIPAPYESGRSSMKYTTGDAIIGVHNNEVIWTRDKGDSWMSSGPIPLEEKDTIKDVSLLRGDFVQVAVNTAAGGLYVLTQASASHWTREFVGPYAQKVRLIGSEWMTRVVSADTRLYQWYLDMSATEDMGQKNKTPQRIVLRYGDQLPEMFTNNEVRYFTTSGAESYQPLEIGLHVACTDEQRALILVVP